MVLKEKSLQTSRQTISLAVLSSFAFQHNKSEEHLTFTIGGRKFSVECWFTFHIHLIEN